MLNLRDEVNFVDIVTLVTVTSYLFCCLLQMLQLQMLRAACIGLGNRFVHMFQNVLTHAHGMFNLKAVLCRAKTGITASTEVSLIQKLYMHEGLLEGICKK